MLGASSFAGLLQAGLSRSSRGSNQYRDRAVGGCYLERSGILSPTTSSTAILLALTSTDTQSVLCCERVRQPTGEFTRDQAVRAERNRGNQEGRH